MRRLGAQSQKRDASRAWVRVRLVQLSSTFSVLADPTRRAILARLALGETSVTELAKPFPMSMPAVSKHLKVLQRASHISRGHEAQWRPCRLDAGPLKDAAAEAANTRKEQ